MSGINDGGPAYPVAESHHIAADIPWTGGLTIRDYFAGQALVGLCGNPNLFTVDWPKQASQAYAMADAMLAARKEGGEVDE